MSIYISMLRGINVGGQKTIRMEALRELYTGLGFTSVRSYVQSGNMLFKSGEQDASGLVKRIEERIVKMYRFQVSVFIRSANDLQGILANNPFINQRHEDPAKLHVTFLYRIPSEPWWSEMSAPRDSTDEFALGERAIYLFCPNGYGKSKLSPAHERRLSMR
jgi:uncharacterized protein (DUF1697 family)